ncbi:hypothetical protein [Vibrio parahaemolyticus]|uniref:hypothetical protein n=1 Tax=Vibrio parahaemolyticus TaxID=670 RepID=UPI0005F1E24E|nr:hypothetical protein [Vibrio parahaemolyticus]MDX1258059.1 hypothetical protein [Vibrio parahaemolyticus]
MKFSSIEEVVNYLDSNDLQGLDSEYSYRSKELVKQFLATGMDLNRWWVLTPVNWVCPSCQRTKPEIVRLNQHNYLTGHLHQHHDHMTDYVKKEFTKISESMNVVVADLVAERFVERTAFALSAYDPTIICSDCNSADADAKKLLRLPQEFSFSPSEISRFIISKANEKPYIDKLKAQEVWKECEPMFYERQRLVKEIAGIAAKNKHWYQPSQVTARYVERSSDIWIEKYGLDSLGIIPYEQTLYSTNKFKGRTDSWRKNKYRKYVNPPTEGQINHLIALRGDSWNKAGENWQCAVCDRKKVQCVTQTNKGEWRFSFSQRRFFSLSDEIMRHDVCGCCGIVATNFAKEVKAKCGLTEVIGSISFVTLEELKKLVIPRPNQKHKVNNEYAEYLIPILAERIKT